MIGRNQLIRLAHSNPELQPRLLQAVQEGLEFKSAEELASWVKSAKAAPSSKKLIQKAEKLLDALEGSGHTSAINALKVELANTRHQDNSTTRARLENAISRAEKAKSKMAAEEAESEEDDSDDKAKGKTASIGRNQLIRLAKANPALQPRLLEAIEAGLEFKSAGDLAKWVRSAAPRGKTQKALMAVIEKMSPGQSVPLTDLTRGPKFRLFHFAQLMSSAEALAKQGYIDYDGNMVTKLASKTASSDSTACGEREIEVENEIGEVEIGEININMGDQGKGDNEEWAAHLGEFEDSTANMMLASGPDLVQSYLMPNTDQVNNNPFAGERDLTAVDMEAGKPCPVNPPEGLRVTFANTMEAMLSYGDAPPPGTKGTVQSARTAGRVATSHDGRVFVAFDDHKTMAVAAQHLLVSEAQRKKAQRKTASMTRRASSIDALLAGDEFVKLAEDTLVHKATRDLWGLRQEPGGYVIERLFEDDGSPLKLAAGSR